MAKQYPILYVHYTSFIHSSFHGRLGCFHILGIVTNAAVIMMMQISLWESVFILFPEVELLDDILVLFLIFWRNSILFFIMSVPIYISTNNAQRFLFLQIFINTFFFGLFDNNHFNRFEGIILTSWFLFAFPRWLVMLSIFSCTRWSFVCLLWKSVY